MDDPKYVSRRSPVLGTHGMVSTSQPLASEIGLGILKSGGNAVDAAIAVAAALSGRHTPLQKRSIETFLFINNAIHYVFSY